MHLPYGNYQAFRHWAIAIPGSAWTPAVNELPVKHLIGLGVALLAGAVLGWGLLCWIRAGIRRQQDLSDALRARDREISELRNCMEDIVRQRTADYKKLAVTDALTGLYNYRYLYEGLAIEIERTVRGQAPLSLIIFDIDYFKAVNDQHGHIEGDKVLQHIAACLGQNARSSDIVGRYGGEEFLMILPQTTASQARVIAERLRLAISGLCIGKQRIQVTVSAGIAEYQGEGLEGFMKKADNNMYRAKGNGRNTVV